MGLVETSIESEEGRLAKPDQKWDDLIIIHPQSANIVAYLSTGNTPPP